MNSQHTMNATQPGNRTQPDDRVFMTPMEFAALPSDVHHAVWAAYSDRRIDTFPAVHVHSSAPRRYRRDQVQAIVADLAESLAGPMEAARAVGVWPARERTEGSRRFPGGGQP